MATNRAAHFERQLQKLRQDYEAIKQELEDLGCILPGSLQKREYKCGKPTCRCATQGKLHGPYYQWTRKVDGKTVNLNLDREVALTAKEWIQNRRSLRRICQRLQRTSLAMLKILEKRESLEST